LSFKKKIEIKTTNIGFELIKTLEIVAEDVFKDIKIKVDIRKILEIARNKNLKESFLKTMKIFLNLNFITNKRKKVAQKNRQNERTIGSIISPCIKNLLTTKTVPHKKTDIKPKIYPFNFIQSKTNLDWTS
ncbi:MAG: hypothetical protein NC917_03720, partial [Candidatus Omnitrophica bacterium]|nr:hypothetical protein [Candidatus Omnitrophota bacterium]